MDLGLRLRDRLVHLRHHHLSSWFQVQFDPNVHLPNRCFFQRHEEVPGLRDRPPDLQVRAARPRDLSRRELLSPDLLDDWMCWYRLVAVHHLHEEEGYFLQRDHSVSNPNPDLCHLAEVYCPRQEQVQDEQFIVQGQLLQLHILCASCPGH